MTCPKLRESYLTCPKLCTYLWESQRKTSRFLTASLIILLLKAQETSDPMWCRKRKRKPSIMKYKTLWSFEITVCLVQIAECLLILFLISQTECSILLERKFDFSVQFCVLSFDWEPELSNIGPTFPPLRQCNWGPSRRSDSIVCKHLSLKLNDKLFKGSNK